MARCGGSSSASQGQKLQGEMLGEDHEIRPVFRGDVGEIVDGLVGNSSVSLSVRAFNWTEATRTMSGFGPA